MKNTFYAQFNDGTLFAQDENDVHPTKQDKSSFTYLLEEAVLHDGIASFWLDGNGRNYLVDLKDGHFEIDGTRFNAHEQDLAPKDLRLVYFRRHTHKMNIYGMEVAHDVEYFLGWQMTDDEGKNHQQTISIK
jgi:hypothetical protein